MSDQKTEARVDAMGDGSHSLTARDERAGSAHSPLPWRNLEGRWIVAADARTVAQPYIGGETPHDVRKANAAFIVTACNHHHELVAALKDIDALDICDGYSLADSDYPQLWAAIDRARAVLAKLSQ